MKAMVYKFLVVFIAVGILTLIAIKYYSDIIKNHKDSSYGVINHDEYMRVFCYKVNKSKQEIVDALLVKSKCDEADCSFDPHNQIITFTSLDHRDPINYQLTVMECDGFSIVKVSQINRSWLAPAGVISYRQNPFWVKEMQAEPVSYSLYH